VVPRQGHFHPARSVSNGDIGRDSAVGLVRLALFMIGGALYAP